MCSVSTETRDPFNTKIHINSARIQFSVCGGLTFSRGENDTLFPNIMPFFWPGTIRLWSYVVHYVGNRLLSGTQTEFGSTLKKARWKVGLESTLMSPTATCDRQCKRSRENPPTDCSLWRRTNTVFSASYQHTTSVSSKQMWHRC
jgi:hypothetical protein